MAKNKDFDFETKLKNFVFFSNVCHGGSLLSLINNGVVSPFTVGELFYDLSTEGKIKMAYFYSIGLACEKNKKDLQIFKSDDELHEFLKIYYFLKENHKKAKIIDEEYDVLFIDKKYKYQFILPHKGTEFRYLLRKAKIKGFDRWANSTDDEILFDTLDNLMYFLKLEKM